MTTTYIIVVSIGQTSSTGNIDRGVSMSKAWIQAVSMAGNNQELWLWSVEESAHHINYLKLLLQGS